MILVALTLWSIVVSANSLSRRDTNIHVARTFTASGFSRVGPASPDTTLDLRFALTQNDPDGLIDALYSVSDPSSPTYGKYLSKEEVEAFVSPASSSVEAVSQWLLANNVTSTTLSPSGDWIGMKIPVSQANELFDAEFDVFSHEDTQTQVIRTLQYSIPQSLQAHVDLIHPTISFPSISSMTASQRNGRSRLWVDPSPAPLRKRSNTVDTATSACNNGTTPVCLQELYQIPSAPAVNKSNHIGVTGFYGNEAHFAYLEVFLEVFRPDMDPATNFTVVGIDGGSDEQNPYAVIEGDLDIQYTVSVATDVNVTEYFVGPNITDGVFGFLDEANFLAALDVLPQVLTTSYAVSETEWDFEVSNKICQIYAQLGARGTTMLFASGDAGPGCGYTNITNFEAMFPASCPYVTAVGGTASYFPETAWSGSGGGFSTYYPRPAYQDAVVSAYLASPEGTAPANVGRFNASGRGIPDIAAHAENFTVYAAGYYAPTYGTSAASPTIASIVGLLNDRLLSAGRPQMGWLNPWLYSEGYKAFTDIATNGSLVHCETAEDSRGWNASVGWDPVTGLGAPSFDALLALLDL